MKAEISIRWRLGREKAEELDPLMFRLLEEVEQGESLRGASAAIGVSYRHAWGLMQAWEKNLGAPLLELERGRGATLSAAGRCLLWARRRASARLNPLLESLAAEVEQELGGLLVSGSPVAFVASHDLALGELRDRLNAAGGHRFNLRYRGSLEAVRELAAGRCDLAGFHLPDSPGARSIEDPFRRLLPAERFRLVKFVHRRQGLMVPPGNPEGIGGLADLTREGIRFVNRQPGSGTRLLFDALIEEAGIAESAIDGYDNEEFTHLAVAAMVASGAASAGFGVQAAAAQFGLDFLPLARERYLLAFERAAEKSPWVGELARALESKSLRKAIAALEGYEVEGMGMPAEFSAN